MPAHTDPDGYGRPVAVTLLLALDAADTTEPVGLARPALALAAVLDPAGHPDTLWATPAVTDYLTTHRTTTNPSRRRLRLPGRRRRDRVTADQAYKALRLLHRYGLLTHTPTASALAVRIHALTARAAREAITDLAPPVRAAADGLLHLWPNLDHTTTDLVDALRTNTATLTSVPGDVLWHPDRHPTAVPGR